MPLLSLPYELLQLIVEYLDAQRDLNALVRTGHALYDNFNGYLYRCNARRFNRTALLWAVRHGHEGTLEKSLREEPYTEIRDESRLTPLLLSVKLDRLGIFHRLLTMPGVDLEARDLVGRTPIANAAYLGREEMVRLLLANSADRESKDSDNQTPLALAACEGRGRILKLLLDNGAALESKDRLGQTAVSWAAECGQLASVQLLLARGAAVETRDSSGRTPLSLAAMRGHDAVMKTLLDAGADPDSMSDNGWTPIFWAAFYAHETVVALLLEVGVDPASRDSRGLTPEYLARNTRGSEARGTAVANLLVRKAGRSFMQPAFRMIPG
ncbi:hypothetical protein ARAM_002978 [Aspergillus rambellii]|uniref:Uncharacterized protein n=2 Tax=Aspergillus subgen. Nidulantes TaxID=2720870 RepID=A0A0F8WKI4_9EURO|nr:hypothetical protein ARAM_002978 [Aspergillus rambellii]KKK18305.1 hypothetical protein AOCH_003478 [Aspergillus ochraceoroseus]